MSNPKLVSKLLSPNPKQVVEAVKEWVESPFLVPNIRYEVLGRGFPPIAFTLGGAVSAAGAIVITSIFGDRVRYIITSPEVVEGKGPLSLSKQVLEKLVKLHEFEVKVVPFDILEGGHAELVREVLKQGSLIVNGVSAEFALWLGRNAGIGRLLVYRPREGIATFRFV